MENALYYTLSTIAQTLAGALAVLVAIVLFRLQRLEDLISKGQALLQSKSTPYAESWPILRDQGWAAVSDFMTSKGDDPLRERGARQISEGAYHAWQTQGRVLPALYTALSFTIVDIALCFVALPYTSSIAPSKWAVPVLRTTVILGIICLVLYVWLIVSMVRRPPD